MHMWPNLRKAGFHAHNSKTHISPSNDACILYINYPFSQVLVLKISQAVFAVACFWGLSDLHECSGVLQMAPSPLDKQTADCDSPHNWLMSLAMDLAVLCDM